MQRRAAVFAEAPAARRSPTAHRPIHSRLCDPNPTLNPGSVGWLNPDPLLIRQPRIRDAGSIPAASTFPANRDVGLEHLLAPLLKLEEGLRQVGGIELCVPGRGANVDEYPRVVSRQW
jgi:hypothetical protein